MTEAEVADRLWEWLTATLGIEVIYAYQGETPPSEPYAVMNLILADAVHENPIEDEFIFDDEQANQAPVRDWFWRFSLNVYGGAGKTILRRVKTAEHVQAATEALLPFTIFETSAIRDATELLNEEFQARAQMDIEIRGIVRDALPIDTIEQAPVEFDRL